MSAAPTSFYHDVLRKDRRFTSTDACKDLGLLEPGTRAAVEALLIEARDDHVDLRVLETFRSQARQHMLFVKHATQLSRVGCHGFGVAVDFALYQHGSYVEDGSKYEPLWALLKRHGLMSGQDWGQPDIPHSFRDSDHAQRVPLWRQPGLFAETWFPPIVYDWTKDVQPRGSELLA